MRRNQNNNNIIHRGGGLARITMCVSMPSGYSPMKHNTPKILIYDIEVTPESILGYPTRRNNESIKLKTLVDQQIFSVSWKWRGEKKTHFKSIWDLSSFVTPKDPRDILRDVNDMELVSLIRDLMDEADVVIGHYSNNFDNPKTMARIAYHRLEVPSAFEELDTKRLSSQLGQPSNKLDEIGRYYGLGRKDGDHASLWYDCLMGDKKAQKKMMMYNNQDVILTEDVFDFLIPYLKKAPNLAKYFIDYGVQFKLSCVCEMCGSDDYVSKGVRSTRTSFRKDYKCNECGNRFAGNNLFKTHNEALAAPKGM